MRLFFFSLATVFLLPALCFSDGLVKDEALFTAAEAEQSATIKTLKKLVNVETGTGDKEGLRSIGLILEEELKAIGATVTRHKAVGGVIGDNLVGRLKGDGTRKVMLMAHMDTVYARGTLATAPFRIEGNKAYGPGIGDDKSGIAIILHSLRLLKNRGYKEYAAITIVFNTDEEQGSAGSRDLIRTLAGEHDEVLSFEPTYAGPEVLSLATSGIGAAYVNIKGKAAHSGMSPELGTNALVELSDFVLRSTTLDEGPGKLRFNWTVGKAGSVANIIPDSATLRADIRYPNEKAFEKVIGDLKAMAANPHLKGSEINIEVSTGRPAFNANEGGKALIKKAAGIYQSLGYELKVIPIIGGGTDAAYAAQSGKPVIEALGLPGFGYHGNSGEYVFLDAIPRRLYLAAKLISAQ